MDRSIRYVREHKVAPLLNDMLKHLLLTQADDPVSALIVFLEKQMGHKGSSSHAARPSATTSSSSSHPLSSGGEPAAVDAQVAPPASAEEDLHELIADILRNEHAAQLSLERSAASHPRSFASVHDLLDRFHTTSKKICAVVESLEPNASEVDDLRADLVLQHHAFTQYLALQKAALPSSSSSSGAAVPDGQQPLWDEHLVASALRQQAKLLDIVASL